MRRYIAALFASWLSLHLPSLVAQGATIARVEVLETAQESGLTTADVVVPVPEGLTRTEPRLVTDQGMLCDVRRTGAPWPDGSIRYLALDLPVRLTAGQRRTVALRISGAPRPVFTVHPTVGQKLANVWTWFRAAGQRVGFRRPVLVEDGRRVRVYRSHARCTESSMWARLHILVMHETAHMRFYLEWGSSNPDFDPLHENPGEVAFEIRGGANLRVAFANSAAKILGSRAHASGKVYILHRGGYLADGQSQCMEGRLSFAANDAPRARAIAKNWQSSKAFGPFGELIPEAKIPPAWWAQKIAKDAVAQAVHPWAAPLHGCNADPSNTGTQADFGTIVMRPDVLLGDPSRLPAVARSVYQEWCRPTHVREIDVSPVIVANHPNWITRSGRAHFRAGKDIDLLGKTPQYLINKRIAPDSNGHAFRGHDAQHLSINYLCAFALLTGDRLAREECDHRVELWLSEFTHDSGTFNDEPGAARAVGRSLQAGCWLWLVTGRADLKERILQRTRALIPYLMAPRPGEAGTLPNVLVPRHTGSRGHYWAPWEEGIAVVGLAAVRSLFQLPEAAALADIVSQNLVAHGVGITPSGWRVGYKIPLATEGLKPYFAMQDARFASHQAGGSGLTMWTLPAILLASRQASDPRSRWLAGRMLDDLVGDASVMGHDRVFEWLPVFKR